MSARRRPRRAGGTLRDGERRQLARASRVSRAGAAPLPPGDTARVLCDGGSRGNPGPAAVAAVLLSAEGAVAEQRARRIGIATAAEAEYRAMLLALELASAHGVETIEVFNDSRLAVAAVTGEPPREPALAALVGDVRAAESRFAAVTWTWHPGSHNAAADALVRELLWDPR